MPGRWREGERDGERDLSMAVLLPEGLSMAIIAKTAIQRQHAPTDRRMDRDGKTRTWMKDIAGILWHIHTQIHKERQADRQRHRHTNIDKHIQSYKHSG